MGPFHTKVATSGLCRLFAVATLGIAASYAQSQPVGGRCLVTAVPNQVRSEGITEPMGDIVLDCTGSNPGAVLSGNFSVFLPVSVTNRVDSSNRTQDAVFSADYGNGFVPIGVPGFISSQVIAFNGISVTIPPSGNIKLKISNIRGNVNQLGSSVPQQIFAQLSFSSNASIAVNQSQLIVAFSQ